MSVGANLKILLALVLSVLATLVLSVLAVVQALLQTVVLFLALVGANILTLVLFPLQVCTFPLWVLFWLMMDTAVLVYSLYLWWWTLKAV